MKGFMKKCLVAAAMLGCVGTVAISNNIFNLLPIVEAAEVASISNVRFNGNIITWDNVDGAIYYTVQVKEKNFAGFAITNGTDSNTIDISSSIASFGSGDYDIIIRAFPTNDSGNGFSNQIAYVKIEHSYTIEKLSLPEVSWNIDYTGVRIEKVENATRYTIKLIDKNDESSSVINKIPLFIEMKLTSIMYYQERS